MSLSPKKSGEYSHKSENADKQETEYVSSEEVHSTATIGQSVAQNTASALEKKGNFEFGEKIVSKVEICESEKKNKACMQENVKEETEVTKKAELLAELEGTEACVKEPEPSASAGGGNKDVPLQTDLNVNPISSVPLSDGKMTLGKGDSSKSAKSALPITRNCSKEDYEMSKKFSEKFSEFVTYFTEPLAFDGKLFYVSIHPTDFSLTEAVLEPKVEINNNRFVVSLDVSFFNIRNIHIQVVGDKISVHAEQNNDNDYGHRYQEMHQVFIMPKYVSKDKIAASRTKCGVLIISAPIDISRRSSTDDPSR